jgi:acyl carrier protein
MVPGVMVEVAELPRLPNGKVDRRALPDLMSAAFGEQKGFVAPQTLAERTIAEVWQQVLGVGNVDVHHNFFELGGHSLALARVQSKLQTAFDKSISMVELFKNPTISALARHLSEGQAEDLTLQKAQERANKRRRAGHRQPQRAAEQVGER